MKIILHGLLAERFGREHEIMTSVPADAIEGLSRQLEGWPRDLAVSVLDFGTEAALRTPTDTQELHIMPSMHGGGGVGKIIVGTVLIVIGVALVVFSSGTLAMIGVNLIITGAAIALGGVAELLMKAPTVDNGGPADPPASRYFAINKNTTAVGTLIIMAYGRILLAGHWLSLQVNSSDMVTTNFPNTTT